MKNILRFLRRAALGLSVSAGTWMLMIPAASADSIYSGDGLKEGLQEVSGMGLASSLSLKELIMEIITFILDIVLLLGILAIIVAGIYLIVSNGDEGQKDKAKKIVLYVIAGILLILLARVIVMVVNNIF